MSRIGKLVVEATAPHTVRQFRGINEKPMDAQHRLLRHLLAKNADTEFGSTHGFAGIDGMRRFQQTVPLATYESLEPYVFAAMDGKPRQLTHETPVLFATTSGTTGPSKYIPVTPEGRTAKSHAMRVWLSKLVMDHPRIAAGRILSVVSPEVESRAPCGTPCGAESGHVYRNIPKAVVSMYSAPYEVYEVHDYEAKYYTLLRIAAGHDVSILTVANPSTVLLLANRLETRAESIIRDVRDGTLAVEAQIDDHLLPALKHGLRPDPARAKQLELAVANGDGTLRLDTAWPNLAAIACWKGGTVGSYVARFPDHFSPSIPIRDLGYLATEVRGTVPLSDEGDAGVLTVTTNVFEFFPVEADRAPTPDELLTLDQLEVGTQYFIYVTTPSGLYRYDMNDIIEVTGRYERTPLIRFVQKGKGVLSFTGEKLYESQVLAAVERAFTGLGVGAYEFITAVGEIVGDTNPLPRLVFLVEFRDDLAWSDGEALARNLDRALGDHNVEYRTKRDSLRYGPPVIRMVRRGEFDRYRRRMVELGRSDGQFKILRLTTDQSFAAQFEADGDVVAAS